MTESEPWIAVVIPCYRVSPHILSVLAAVPTMVGRIYVIDDACPDRSGDVVAGQCRDPRVEVIRNPENLGVGGATLKGFVRAAADGASVLVKIDGDGQMAPSLIPRFVTPILEGRADATKGNRFFDPGSTQGMPSHRWIGNAALSFLSKLSSGYWNLFDATNGYLALDARVFRWLPADKLASRYFFESDLLFRLGTLRAVVLDVPIRARYGQELSSLVPHRNILPFLKGHLRNTGKRIAYSYFLRDFSAASVNLLLGALLTIGGVSLGTYQWWSLSDSGELASSGTVMLAALPIILGFQLLLSALTYDIQNVPREPVARHLDTPPEEAI